MEIGSIVFRIRNELSIIKLYYRKS